MESLPSPALRILTANDVYKPERFAKLKTLAERYTGATVTKFVLPGDLLGGSLFAVAHHGESVIDVLNALSVDYCTLGNHEFDFGAERTRELMDKSRFPWVGSNVREASPPESSLFHTVRDFDVFSVCAGGEVGTVKVGVFGLCTAATPELSRPGPSVTFESPVEHAKRCVAALHAQGCELIIALTHLALEQDKKVAEACAGVRVILGGHDHDPFVLNHHGTFIAKCGQNGDHLGVLDLHLERQLGALHAEHSFSLVSTHHVPPSPAIVEVASQWSGGDVQNEEVCHVVDVPLSTKSQELRSRENAFGCHVADAVMWSFRAEGCEMAVQNGGFVRQNNLYPVGAVLTASQLKEEMPFARTAVLLRLRGEDFRRGLEEMMASAPVPCGSFPHVSKGLQVFYKPQAPKLNKIERVIFQGEELDPAREYLVAISDFYAESPGDGVEAFTRGQVVHKGEEVIGHIAVEFFRGEGKVTGALPGRLVALP